MYGYKCSVCECSLDPGEGRICEDCAAKRESQVKELPKITYGRKEKEGCYAS